MFEAHEAHVCFLYFIIAQRFVDILSANIKE